MIRATDLRVDDDPRLLGVDHLQPAFSWVPCSGDREQSQTAYRLLVASSLDKLDADVGDCWDSGRVESSATYAIEYAGRPLLSAEQCFWKVRLWDQDGVVSDESPTGTFGMGLLEETDWSAQWIGRGSPNEPRVDVSAALNKENTEKRYGPIDVEEGSDLLRKEWTPARRVRRAVAFVCGLGFYELQINGQRVGRNELSPAKTDYRKQVLYDAFDVTRLVHEGSNAFGLHLGNGWYNPVKEFWDWQMQWHGSKRALLQLHIEYADGSSEVFGTDASWRAAPGPITFSCIYGGEVYDARLEQTGWDRPGFDDSRWKQVNIVAAPGGVMHHHALEPIQITQTIRPTAVWEAGPGVFIFDMGQNFSGFARLRVRGASGVSVTLRHAENVTPAGALDPLTNGRARNTDVYTLKGEGEETYQPRFTYHGFRYLEMTGFPGAPTLDAIEGCVIHSACRQTGEFSCANALINRIHHCTLWSQRSNMMGLPTDDNQRDERLGWMGDGHVTAEEFMCNFDAPRFYRKWLRDIKHGQDAVTGNLPYVSPRPTVSGTPAWSSAYPLVLWYLYEDTGDVRILKEHYGPVKAYVDFLGTTAKDHILPRDRYGDHLSLNDGKVRGDPVLAATFYYYYDTILLVRMADLLGHREDVAKYSALAETIRDAFRRTFFDTGRNVFGTGTQCELAMGLLLDLEPDGTRSAVLQRLIEDIVATHGGHLNTGILGTKYVMDVLARDQRCEVGWALTTREDYPSWGNMIRGYTTLSECWDRTGTNNHVMFGSVDAWFYKVLGGIRSVAERPGYAHVRIQPHVPPDLDWVRTSIVTVRGRVASAWIKEGGRLYLEVTVPANVTAEIVFPADRIRGGKITENDHMVWNDGFCGTGAGLLGGERDGETIRLRIGSGRYRFGCEWVNTPSIPAWWKVLTHWHSSYVTTWQLSRLMPACPVEEAPCVQLTDDLAWTPISGDSFINVHERYGDRDGLVYLANRFRVEQAGEWTLHVGHDGGMRLFVDGVAVATEPKRVNPAPRLRTSASIQLAAGLHEVVIAFDTDEGLGWGLSFGFEILENNRRDGFSPDFPTVVERVK